LIVFVTLWNFAWKKIKKELVFDFSYIFTMLISAIASMAILPVFFINSALPANNGLFVFLATASMSGLLSHYRQQLVNLKQPSMPSR
jgi:amino acid transporter